MLRVSFLLRKMFVCSFRSPWKKFLKRNLNLIMSSYSDGKRSIIFLIQSDFWRFLCNSWHCFTVIYLLLGPKIQFAKIREIIILNFITKTKLWRTNNNLFLLTKISPNVWAQESLRPMFEPRKEYRRDIALKVYWLCVKVPLVLSKDFGDASTQTETKT